LRTDVRPQELFLQRPEESLNAPVERAPFFHIGGELLDVWKRMIDSGPCKVDTEKWMVTIL